MVSRLLREMQRRWLLLHTAASFTPKLSSLWGLRVLGCRVEGVSQCDVGWSGQSPEKTLEQRLEFGRGFIMQVSGGRNGQSAGPEVSAGPEMSAGPEESAAPR